MKYRVHLTVALMLLGGLFSGVAAAQSDAEFSEWLKARNAWDVLASINASDSDSPEAVLERSDYLLRMGKAEPALELLQRSGPFGEDTRFEAQRLWTMARAERALQHHAAALILYMKAGDSMTQEEFASKCLDEPGLERFWETVWLALFWDVKSGPWDDAAGDRQEFLSSSREAAMSLWPESRFWAYSGESRFHRFEAANPDFDVLLVEDMDSVVMPALIRALGAWSRLHWEQAEAILSAIPQPEVRVFWRTFGSYLKTGQISDDFVGSLRRSGLFKAAHFWDLGWTGFDPRRVWTIPDLEGKIWAGYLLDLHALSSADALDRIALERTSPLIPQEYTTVLEFLRVSHLLSAGHFQEALTAMESLPDADLPLSFRLARIFIQNAPGSEHSLPREHQEALRLLSESADIVPPGTDGPFWLVVQDGNGASAASAYPLDRVIAFGGLQEEWERSPSPAAAKRIAMLYPGTTLGYQALLFLAREAHDQGETRLAWTYLNEIGAESISREREAEFLEARAGLEMELGWEDRAMATYSTLLSRYPQWLSPDKRMKVALYAQQRGNWTGAQRILDTLWKSRETLSRELQAEILFWIGEGYQQQGELDRALHSYLRLAWAYPEQNIWAVTALYRSALINEQKGSYDAAAALLSEVLKKADRKSQKEAAQDRLNAISGKGRVRQPDAILPFPF
ncbi:MAG: tetratricopeptide repeat protein [bacterium]